MTNNIISLASSDFVFLVSIILILMTLCLIWFHILKLIGMVMKNPETMEMEYQSSDCQITEVPFSCKLRYGPYTNYVD